MQWRDADRALKLYPIRGGYPGMPAVRKLLVHCLGGKTWEVSYTGEDMMVYL